MAEGLQSRYNDYSFSFTNYH